MADPIDFAKVKLLLLFNGSDGSTTFTDSSSSARTVTRVGALVKTDQSKFGGASGYFDGVSDYLSVPNSADFAFGADDWTIEFWFRPSSISTAQYLIGRGIDSAGNGNYPFNVYITSGGSIIGRCHDGTSNYSTPAGTMSAGTWKHVAFVRYSNSLKLYIDGVATGAGVSITTSVVSASDAVCVGNFSVAFAGGSGSSLCARGHFDDLRITKGEALYTGDFTPPTAQLPTTGATWNSYSSDAGPLGSALALGSVEVASFVSADGPFGPAQALGACQVDSLAAADGPLGAAMALANQLVGVVLADGPLGAVLSLARQIAALSSAEGPLSYSAYLLASHDFSSAVGNVAQYVMDLIDGDDIVTRVPISSWQSTQQVERSNYLQCVIPAATDWVDELNAAVTFVVYRRSILDDGFVVEYEMARSVVTEVRFDTGPTRSTCTLSGYEDGIADPGTPPAAYDRDLAGVRLVSTSGSGLRVRCAIDWLLRPGHRAYVDGSPFIVGYMNLYATGTDAYMDVGELAA